METDEDEPGWKTVQTTTLWSSEETSFSISRDLLRDPQGQEHEFTYVEQGKRGVYIVPIFDDLDTVLIDQYRPIVSRTFREVPAGGVELGQTSREAAETELFEETGLRAANFTHIGGFYASVGLTTSYADVFVATGISILKRPRTDEPISTCQRIPLDGALDEANTGRLEHCGSIAALNMAADWIRRQRNA